ncbi:MAG TPA: ABC transporter permease, partial [Bryobacteraceae bacterium]|nr:ABC transporter permease [Bryobacteraceae bacterium]
MPNQTNGISAAPGALLQDLRYAFRVIGQNPGFAAVAVLSLALGIGANTAIFSIVDAVMLKWLPVSSPQELVVIARNPEKPSVGFNYPDYEYIRDHNHVFAGVVVSGGGGALSMTVPDEGSHAGSQLVQGFLVSGNFFEVLGVKPAIGRLFTAEDNKTAGAHPYAILSYGFWKSRFGAEANVLGRKITLNGSPFTIVGVSRQGFTGPQVGSSPSIFLPIMMLQQVSANARNWNSRHYWWLTPLARLKPGVNVQNATAEADVLFKQIEQNDPERTPTPTYDKDRERRNRAVLLPGSGGYSNLRNRLSKPLAVLGVVVGLVLLIACANVANLLLARAASRQKEIAIRVAIGAGRLRLISQLVTEALILSVLGGIAGLAFAYWSVKVLLGLMPQDTFPISLSLSPDFRLLGFSFGVSLLTGFICGIVPALRATRPDVVSSLKNDASASGSALSRFGLGRLDLRKTLVVVQVALSLLLLVGAGLFVRSLENLRDLDPGFLRENVLLVRTSAGSIGYKGQRMRTFEERLREAAARLPGVRVASLARITPLEGSRWNGDIAVQGYQWRPDERPYVNMNAVSGGYFETLGIPILQGRDFTDRDNPPVTPDPPDKSIPPGQKIPVPSGPAKVAIVNQAMAKKFFPNESAIGKRFSNSDKFKFEDSFEIVGVVKDTRYFGLREPIESMVYFPNWRQSAGDRMLCLRSTADAKRLIDGVRHEVRNLDSAIPVLQTITMDQQVNNNVSQERLIATLCSFFGGLALLLAAVGLYGLMAHTATRRTREIG